ncbi:hypothetical protein [Vibrio algicola]|uniref:Uncharacterized protein n=1 Tax=Vibrio algicola TaxID=2662262 RepID=A0A5Q0TIM6_9VIBR|nr:hypothetical protein [Vibrio algicola]
MKNQQLIKDLEFIIDAVALSTSGESRAEQGLRIMNIVIANSGAELSPQVRAQLKNMIDMADEAESPAFQI